MSLIIGKINLGFFLGEGGSGRGGGVVKDVVIRTKIRRFAFYHVKLFSIKARTTSG